MNRFAAGLVVAITAVFSAEGAEPDVSARVRAALCPNEKPCSIAVQVQVALKLAANNPSCGICLTLPDAEAKARPASAPIVLFVGGCSSRASEVLAGTSAIAARAERYDADETLRTGQADERRIVVLRAGNPAMNEWIIHAVLPADSNAADVRAMLPTPPRPVQAQSIAPTIAPSLLSVPGYTSGTVCVGKA